MLYIVSANIENSTSLTADAIKYDSAKTLYKITDKFPKTKMTFSLPCSLKHFRIQNLAQVVETYLTSTKATMVKNVQIKVTYDAVIDPVKLYDTFWDFYQKVVMRSPTLSIVTPDKCASINVYTIHYEKTVEEKMEPNPAYNEWMEIFGTTMVAPAAEAVAQPTADGTAVATAPQPKRMSGGMEMPMDMRLAIYSIKPDKTIKMKTTKTELICKSINKVFKDIKSLYLRENDKNRLLSVLDKFKNRHDIYETLGLPYKLGMLFHGTPGTGKTSTIKSIASFLGKDIYFVNLKNVRTNSELKAIFEHINEKCNGGIIVFEDMDASCEVVKRRVAIDETQAGTMVETMEEEHKDQLTLSYLLNLFDGTICRDGTIFAITTNHVENLDPALYRDGRIDINIEFKKCDHFQIAQIYRSIIGRELPAALMARIPEFEYSPANIIFHIYHYMLDDQVPDEVIMSKFLLP